MLAGVADNGKKYLLVVKKGFSAYNNKNNSGFSAYITDNAENGGLLL